MGVGEGGDAGRGGGGSSRRWAWVGEGRWVEGRDVACGVRMGWGVRGGSGRWGRGNLACGVRMGEKRREDVACGSCEVIELKSHVEFHQSKDVVLSPFLL